MLKFANQTCLRLRLLRNGCFGGDRRLFLLQFLSCSDLDFARKIKKMARIDKMKVLGFKLWNLRFRSETERRGQSYYGRSQCRLISAPATSAQNWVFAGFRHNLQGVGNAPF